MQNFPRVGDVVQARRRRWRVADVREYPACALVTLDAHPAPSPSDVASGISRTRPASRLLVPFDEVQAARETIRLVRVDRSRWFRRLARLSSATGDADSLQAAPGAHLDLLAYQLEPAIALLRGRARRLLIADDVGLGKTVQAGIVVAELLTRGLVDRVLVVAPAGLREQWAAELATRFALDFAVLDMRGIQTRRAQLPAHVNPWTTEARVVTSIDYVKRPETLPAVAEGRWDLVIVDEAHGAVAGERHEAVVNLCSNAGTVILTATPHSGDRVAFERLCAIGSTGDPLLFFRRTRTDVGLPRERRVHPLHVRSTPDERAMYAVLERFAEAVRREHEQGADAALALAVLRKRAMSSASSLARTVRRRLDQLSSSGGPLDEQLPLDFGDPAGEHDADHDPDWTCPPLRDAAREQRLLTEVVEAAAHASLHESKVSALRRLLARVREPALVFTEYRDTLLHLRDTVVPGAAILHGGLSRPERAAAIQAFTRGNAGVLLATDAAGEGLNLHHRCRVVINVELPWNPVRLEQRTGRVDRIGQRRRVHAFHLTAYDAGERAVADRLDARRADAQRDLDDLPAERTDVSREIARLRALRGQSAATCGASDPSNERAAAETRSIAVCIGGRARWRAALGGAAVVVFRSQLIDAAGRTAASRLVPLGVALGTGVRVRSQVELKRLIAAVIPFELARVDPALQEWIDANVCVTDAFWDCCGARALAIFQSSDGWRGAWRQPSLFTQRMKADQEMQRRARIAAAAQFQLIAARHRRTLTVVTNPVLILLP